MHHLREAGARTAKGTWLAELRRYGLEPTVEILEEIKVEQKQRYIAEERERHWIRVFEQSGAFLSNIRDTLAYSRKSSNREQGNSYTRKLSNSIRELDNSKETPNLDQLQVRASLHVNEIDALTSVFN
jgi:hypothetical protein